MQNCHEGLASACSARKSLAPSVQEAVRDAQPLMAIMKARSL